eukprot:333027-Pleurochrysis_carterae.AAC.1
MPLGQKQVAVCSQTKSYFVADSLTLSNISYISSLSLCQPFGRIEHTHHRSAHPPAHTHLPVFWCAAPQYGQCKQLLDSIPQEVGATNTAGDGDGNGGGDGAGAGVCDGDYDGGESLQHDWLPRATRAAQQARAASLKATALVTATRRRSAALRCSLTR